MPPQKDKALNNLKQQAFKSLLVTEETQAKQSSPKNISPSSPISVTHNKNQHSTEFIFQKAQSLKHQKISPQLDKIEPAVTFPSITPSDFFKSFYSETKSNDSAFPLTVIVKWDNWAFRLLQWDSKCQCFKKLSTNIGIHINSKGLFTIGNKNDSYSWLNTNKKECTGFNSFWWQEWNTWWRTKSYLKISNNEIGRNKFPQSNCSKYPIIVIDKEEEIPYFDSHVKDQLSTRINSRNVYFNTRLRKFVGQKEWNVGKEWEMYFIKNYGDYAKVLGLDPNKLNI